MAREHDLAAKFAETMSSDGAAASTPTETSSTPPVTPATPPPASPSVTVTETPAPATETSPTPVTESPAPESSLFPDDDEFSFPDEPGGKPLETKTPVPVSTAPPVQDPNTPPEVNARGELALKTTRDKQIYATWKSMRDLALPPKIETDDLGKQINKGGLGFTPTVEDIRQFYDSHSDLEAIYHELHSGDPVKSQNVIRHLLLESIDPRTGQVSGPSSGQRAVIQSLPDTLAQSNPRLYVELARPIINRYTEELYTWAESQENPEDRKIAFTVAAGVEAHLTGRARDISGRVSATPPAPDPLRERESRLQSRERQLQQQESSQRQTRVRSIEQGIASEQQNLIQSDISSALDQVMGSLPVTIAESIRDKMYNSVERELKTIPLQRYEILLDTARKTGQPADIQAAAREYQRAARAVIRTLRPQYLKDASAVIVRESQGRHATLSEAATHKGAPASVSEPGSVAPAKVERLPGETHEEFRLRAIKLRGAAVLLQ